VGLIARMQRRGWRWWRWRQGLADVARHFIQCILNLRFLTQTAFHDVASNIWQALGGGVQRYVGVWGLGRADAQPGRVVHVDPRLTPD